MSNNLNRMFLVFGLILYSVFAVHFINYAPDDVWISLRYAENLDSQMGLVYNPGEIVEGYSNFLWVLLMSIVASATTKAGLTLAAKLIGIAGGFFVLILLGIIGKKQLSKDDEKSYWGVAPFSFGLFIYPAFWSASGMETGFYILLVAISILGFFKFIENGNTIWGALSALLFLAVSLTRPEGVIFFAAAAFAVIIDFIKRKRNLDRAFAVWFGIFILTYIAFYIWRFSYFGQWLPNTFYAKAGGGVAKYIEGARYLLLNSSKLLWGNPILLIFPLLPFLGKTGAGIRLNFLGLAVAAQGAFVLFAGGDWMPGARFLIPAMPFVALLLPEGLTAIKNRSNSISADLFTGLAKSMVIMIILSTTIIHLYNAKQVRHDVSGFKKYDGENYFKDHHFQIATWLKQNGSSKDLVALGEAGLIPYLTDMPALDLFGLMDPHLARLPGLRHNKIDTDYVFKKKPRFIVLGGCKILNDGITSDFEYARAILKDSRLHKFYDGVFVYHTFLIYQRKN